MTIPFEDRTKLVNVRHKVRLELHEKANEAAKLNREAPVTRLRGPITTSEIEFVRDSLKRGDSIEDIAYALDLPEGWLEDLLKTLFGTADAIIPRPRRSKIEPARVLGEDPFYDKPKAEVTNPALPQVTKSSHPEMREITMAEFNRYRGWQRKQKSEIRKLIENLPIGRPFELLHKCESRVCSISDNVLAPLRRNGQSYQVKHPQGRPKTSRIVKILILRKS